MSFWWETSPIQDTSPYKFSSLLPNRTRTVILLINNGGMCWKPMWHTVKYSKIIRLYNLFTLCLSSERLPIQYTSPYKTRVLLSRFYGTCMYFNKWAEVSTKAAVIRCGHVFVGRKLPDAGRVWPLLTSHPWKGITHMWGVFTSKFLAGWILSMKGWLIVNWSPHWSMVSWFNVSAYLPLTWFRIYW